MGFFDLFKKKKQPKGQSYVAEKQPKQGFHRERAYVPARVGGLSKELLIMEGNYENDKREGRWTVKDSEGREGFIHYAAGIKHGLEKSPSGGYTLYYNGQRARTHLELTREWESELRGYRAMIKKGEDKERNSSKLKELLAQGEEKWLLETFTKRFMEPQKK